MHIVVKTRDFYKGTSHEDDWLFYHNALTMMTTKDCIAWMKKTLVTGIRTRRTIYFFWVLSQLNLNKNTPGSTAGPLVIRQRQCLWTRP